MKKTYLNPETQVVAMIPQSIICASGIDFGGNTSEVVAPPGSIVPGGGLGGD